MKKTMKKALSVFLAVIVAALMVVPSAFAVSYPEGVTKEKAENAIEKTDDVIYNAVMALENSTLKELITKELYTSDTLSMLLTGVYGMLSEMEASGLDCGGNELAGGAPKFFKGAAVTPVYEPRLLQINKLRQKVEAGARCIQTQGIFDIDSLKRFMDDVAAAGIDVPIMAGIIPLKAAGMAKFMNQNVTGIDVP